MEARQTQNTSSVSVDVKFKARRNAVRLREAGHGARKVLTGRGGGFPRLGMLRLLPQVRNVAPHFMMVSCWTLRIWALSMCMTAEKRKASPEALLLVLLDSFPWPSPPPCRTSVL